MGPEIPFRHTADSLVEHPVHDRAQTSVLMGMNQRHLPVMISRDKQVFPAFIHRNIAAPHTVYVNLVDHGQIPGLSVNRKYRYAFIRYGIQKLSVYRPAEIGRIIHGNDFFLFQCSLFHIHII